MSSNSRVSREKLLTVLDESLKSIFGKGTTETVYYYLGERYSLKLEDILERSQIFMDAIEGMFGDVGASVIEGLLVRDLCVRFGIGKKDGMKHRKLADCLNELMLVSVTQKGRTNSRSKKYVS